MVHAKANNRYTRGLAEFSSGLRYERIPAEVRAHLKLLVLDPLGCALFGARLAWSRILRRTLAAVDTSSRASSGARTSGCRRRTRPWRMARPCRVSSFDNAHRQNVLHVAAVTLAALFAAVETTADSTGIFLLFAGATTAGGLK